MTHSKITQTFGSETQARRGHGECNRTMTNNFYKKACPPSRRFGSRRGITAMELLIVIAVLGIIFAIAVPQFSKMRENQVLKTAVADTLSSINKARSQTLSSLNSSEYGVRFESDKVIIFQGTVFPSGSSSNEIVDIISPATISNITIVGGGVDIYFNRLSGMPSATGTIIISSPNFSKTITIYATGTASMN